MRTIIDIYQEYKIMPQLQEHQLRVASVGRVICQSLTESVDTEGVTRALLLHDMGNILKFELSRFPEFLEPKGLSYWERIKEDYRAKYGSDEHGATLSIARELDVTEETLQYVDATGLSKVSKNLADGSLEEKICNYADMRVGPHGVLSIAERLADGFERYKHRTTIDMHKREKLVSDLYLLEKQIFADAPVRPEDITASSVAPIMEELKSFVIETPERQ